MLKNIGKMRAIIVLCLVLELSSSEAYARGGGYGGGRGGWGGHGGRYYYHGGRWYNSGWLWFGAGVTALAAGAIVAGLPPRHTTVVVSGTPYYYYENTYFRPCPNGYVVVPAPAVTQYVVAAPEALPVQVVQQAPTAPAASAMRQVMPAGSAQDFFTVNVPNEKGYYTAVTLRKSGNGFLGPQGEYYPEFPSVGQLKTMYGK